MYKTTYEWVLEVLEDGDVVDATYADRLASLQPASDEWVIAFDTDSRACSTKRRLHPVSDKWVIALVRQTYCTIDGDLLDKQYAYLQNGILPEYFEDACIRVPKKYHAEAARN